MTNPLQIKEKILSFIKSKGPSLPIHVARAVEISMIFAGAFLSELASEKSLRISQMKVGGSPLYYAPGQEPLLEGFSNYLGKDKEAFFLIKEKSILEDDKQNPQIRVSLRGLKDFAVPFKFNNKIFWRFHTFTEDQVRQKLEEAPVEEVKEEKKEEKKIEKAPEKVDEIKIKVEPQEMNLTQKREEKKEETLDIFSEKPEIVKKPKIEFIEEVKSTLSSRKISIIKIESYNKKEAIIRAKQETELLIFAYNKKKISDKELIKAFKKSLSFKLPYIVLIRDEMSKKMKETIEASKGLLRIEKL